MAVRALLVHFAIPRSTNDTAALRDVNFFSRFSIEMYWDTDAMKTRLPGGQTIVQPSPDLRVQLANRSGWGPLNGCISANRKLRNCRLNQDT